MKPTVKWPLITGIVLCIAGPIIGVSGTVISFIDSFETVAQSGSNDPEKLSADMSSALGSTMIGIIIGLVGLGFLLISLFAYLSDRKKYSPRDSSLEINP